VSGTGLIAGAQTGRRIDLDSPAQRVIHAENAPVQRRPIGQDPLVTGAFSRLGRRFTTVLALSGTRVVVGARRADALADTVSAIADADGQATPVAMDVASTDSVRAARSGTGPFDIVVNIAVTDAPRWPAHSRHARSPGVPALVTAN